MTQNNPRTEISQHWPKGLVVTWPMGITELKECGRWLNWCNQSRPPRALWLIGQVQETATLILNHSGNDSFQQMVTAVAATLTIAPPASTVVVRLNRVCSTIYQEETSSGCHTYQSMAQCLKREYRTMCFLKRQSATHFALCPSFYQTVFSSDLSLDVSLMQPRQKLLWKDNNPLWSISSSVVSLSHLEKLLFAFFTTEPSPDSLLLLLLLL